MSTRLPPVPTVAPTTGERGPTHGTDTEAPSNTSVPGAAGTSIPQLKFTRLKTALRKERRSPRHEAVAPTIRQDVAVLKASGMTTNSIAKTLHRDQTTIRRVQKLPEVQRMITDLRQVWKHTAQDKVTHLAGDTWQMVKEFVSSRDSKQLDNTMRAVAAMEKVSASVAGEGQKVEVTGLPTQPPHAELQVLIQQLFQHDPRSP